MTIEGNWIKGAMTNDYPDVEYKVVELPEGPAGKGTLQFTQCWGIAADSDAQDAGRRPRQLPDRPPSSSSPFAEAFGVMPSRAVAPRRTTSRSSPRTRRSSPAASTARARSTRPGMEQRPRRLRTPSCESFGDADIPACCDELDTNAERRAGAS